MVPQSTFLAPGQRYAEPDAVTWRTDEQVTIVRVEQSTSRVARVVSRCPGGREVVVYADQIEVAIAAGLLVPVAGTGSLACC